MRVAGLGMVVAVLAVLPATAAEVRVGAPVARVVLDPAGALVERRVEVRLGTDTDRLVVTDLPAGLDAASLDVVLAPTDAAAVRTLALRVVPGAEAASPRERELERRIEALRAARREHRDRIEAGRIQLELIRRIGEMAAEGAGRGLAAGEAAPATWRRAWETVGTGALEVLTLIREEERAAVRLEREIDALERELESLRTGRRAVAELVLGITVTRPGPVALRLVHRSDEAAAEPLLEARLDGTTGRLVLARRARVWQRTGEDWRAVRLAVATTDPRRPPSPPHPDPLWVDLREPAPPAPEPPAMALVPRGAERAARMATPERRPFHALFTVPGPVDLPADGRELWLTLERIVLAAEVGVEVVPALDPRPRVVARARHTGPLAVAGGPVRLVRDGAPVGEDRIPGLAPGDELVLGFGIDPYVRVERTELGDLRGAAGIFGGRRRLERRWRIRVHNGHDRPLTVTVTERLPVPRDERIEVTPTDDTTPPDVRDAGGVRGAVAWRLALGPGEGREIVFGYVVTWPEELELVGLGR